MECYLSQQQVNKQYRAGIKTAHLGGNDGMAFVTTTTTTTTSKQTTTIKVNKQ